MPLHRSQKNQVYTLIKEMDLDPSEFEWEKIPSTQQHQGEAEQLIHKPSNFFLLLMNVHLI